MSRRYKIVTKIIKGKKGQKANREKRLKDMSRQLTAKDGRMIQDLINL